MLGVFRAFRSMSWRRILREYLVSVIERDIRMRFHKVCEDCILINNYVRSYAFLTKIYKYICKYDTSSQTMSHDGKWLAGYAEWLFASSLMWAYNLCCVLQ